MSCVSYRFPPNANAVVHHRVRGEENENAVGDDAQKVDDGIAKFDLVVEAVSCAKGRIKLDVRGSDGAHANPDLVRLDDMPVLQLDFEWPKT